MRYEFGEFVLDPDRQELSRGGTPVHLTPKTMQLLEILVEHRPNVVSHQQLYDALWPDVVVLDFAMPGLNGIEACRQITGICPQSKVVLITAADDPEIALAATDAGAAAFVSKYRAAEDLVRVIERVGAVTTPND